MARVIGIDLGTTNSAVATMAAVTKAHAAASASANFVLPDIAYSPSNSCTFAIRSFVEKGLVT